MDQLLLRRVRLEYVLSQSDICLSWLMRLWHLTVKLPFPLTLGFKSMLQRGIQTPDMDVRWVSSLSWYFLNFFGLNGLYRIILGGDEGESCRVGDFFSPCLIYTSRGRCDESRRQPFCRDCACGRTTAGLQQTTESGARPPRACGRDAQVDRR